MSTTLGLDIGEVRTGVARADALGMLAHPLKTITAKSEGDLVEQLFVLIAQEEADTIVVGIPRDQRGKDGPQALKVRSVLARLRERLTGHAFHEVDERFSTAEAERQLLSLGLRRRRRKNVIDQAAAVLILQGWLDSRP